jgi:Ca-activated chloride channel family protein
MRQAAAALFEGVLRDGDRAFLTDFDTRPRLTQAPTERQELLVGRMAGLEFNGHTALYDAIIFSLMQFDGLGGRKALVVLSDGDDFGSRFRPERCIREAQRLGVPIYMVVLEGAGTQLEDVDRLITERLARQTGGQIHFFSSRERLDEIYAAIQADLRSQYLLTYATAHPLSAADLRDIRVEMRDPRLSVRTFLGRSVRQR